MKHFQKIAVAVVLCLMAPLASAKVVRLTLAGVLLSIETKDFWKYDAKAQCYLTSSGDNWESPGAHLGLYDEKYARRRESHFLKGTKVISASLPAARKGWGVNLGDSPAEVRRKLKRRPAKVSRYLKDKEVSWSYRGHCITKIPISAYVYRKAPVRVNKGQKYITRRYDYTASYTFWNGKLVAIEYRLSDPDFEC